MRDIAKIPLIFLLISLILFTLAFFFLNIVFQIFLYINTVVILLTMSYSILFGLIPLFFHRKSNLYQGNELVSIIIPVFNDGAILEKNLQNLVKLTYPNFEILIVYSLKSTDRTEEVALKFAEKFENVRAIPESVSRPFGLNLGIDAANGEYLLFMDSDTFIYNGFIEQALGHFVDENVKIVNSTFLGLNATQNLITRIGWSLSNSIAFYGIGVNKFLKNICFMGFGGIWRKNALLEAGKFNEHTVLDDAELNLRASTHFPKWRGVFDDRLFCYQFYPTDFKTLYLQQEHWHMANIRYNTQGAIKIKMKLRQKFLYVSSFIMINVVPMITLFSVGMIIVQFFANFFHPDVSFGGGVFYFILTIISFFITFSTMLIFAYPKYRSSPYAKLSRKYIIAGIFVIIYLVGIVFGAVSLNSFAKLFSRKQKKEVFVKVDKSDLEVPTKQTGPNL